MFIDIEQGSDEWLKLRKSLVTSTDMAALLGLSPWKSIYDVYLDKSGLSEPFILNSSMKYGSDMEPIVRDYYEAKVDEWFPPAVFISDNGWAMTSLDGINSSHTRILEIKVCNEAIFSDATMDKIPSFYMAQAQHSLMCVPEAKDVVFVFFNKGEYAYVKVLRDEEYIDNIKMVGKEFYRQCIVNKIPPEISENDSLDMSLDTEWMCLAQSALTISENYNLAKKKYDELRLALLECSDDGNCHGGGVKLKKFWRTGSLDLEKMIADKIDVEKYRKSSTCSTILTIEKK